MLLKSAKSIYKGSHEVTSLYLGGNLIWIKPTAEEGNWFIGVTSNVNPYNVSLNDSKVSANSGEKYYIEEPLTLTYLSFYNCAALTSLDVSHLDTSSVTTMNNMFYGCNSLTSLDLSNFDTSKAISMDNMFHYCNSLTTVGDLSNWDTSSVTTMNNMFYSCKSLTSLDLTNWDVSKVTRMYEMFYICNSLTTVGDLSNWDTSSVTTMNSMFYSCKSLTSLDLTNWDVSKVTNMNSMFYNCNSLTSLDLTNWDVSKVTNMNIMFYNCNSLTTVTGPITGISASIDLRYSPLTHDSAMVFVNGLANVDSTKTLTFKSTTYDTLTPEEIALATSKGWSVARS